MEGVDSLFESKILVKSPKLRNKAQRKVNYKNYEAITIKRNYDTKLSATPNYEEKLSQEILWCKIILEIQRIFKIPIIGVNIIPILKECQNTFKKLYSFIEKFEFDFAQHERGRDFGLFFFWFIFFGLKPFKVLGRNKYIFSLHRSQDKVVRNNFICQTLL